MKVFTKEELKEYDGVNKPAYVAYKGKVYDVSDSLMWETGVHMGDHLAGHDLTEEFEDAPHGEDRLEVFPVVGEFRD
jgi:predicted heme/steroid binding protein